MKGTAKIELFNKDGEVVEQVEHNLVTNAFTDIPRIIANLLNGDPTITSSYRLQRLANLYKSSGLSNDKTFAIKLFSDYINNNDPNHYYELGHEFLAYGTDSGTSQDNRGSRISNLTCMIRDEENQKDIGIRLVWEFPSNCANGEIKSICLCPNIFETKLYKTNTMGYSLGNGLGVTDFLNDSSFRVNVSYTREGFRTVTKSEESYSTITIAESNIMDISPIDMVTSKEGKNVITLVGYTDIFKAIELYDGIFATIALNLNTNLYEFLTIDSTTKTIIEQKVLYNNFKEFQDFGLCGDFLILTVVYNSNNKTNYGAKSRFYYYPLNAEEPTDWANLSLGTPSGYSPTHAYSDADSYYPQDNIMTLKHMEKEGFVCEIVSIRGWSTANDITRLTCHLDVVDGIPKYINTLVHTYKAYGNSHPYSPLFNFGTTPIVYINNHCESRNFETGYAYIGYDLGTYFTINNLEVPIFKTEDNSMKITYELIWDNESNK